ncbi:MAG: hypothetical protein NXI01_02495 [Gammaproteobacteria bacterium]|nr:hypothetical protein [Gammaproteobacteria bacterium]
MIQKVQAEIVSSSRLTQTIWQYHIKPEHFINYDPGQYLSVHTNNNNWYYSIAEPVSERGYYELHIRQSPKKTRAIDWKIGSRLELSLPYGDCTTSKLQYQKPVIFIAVGIGYVPIRAMIKGLLDHHNSQKIELYWKVSNPEDLYDKRLLYYWLKNSQKFKFFPSILQTSRQNPIDLIMARHSHDLVNWQIVMAGAFDQIYLQRDFLIKKGLDRKAIFSDAFEFEKEGA